jgi:hypothetical protein
VCPNGSTLGERLAEAGRLFVALVPTVKPIPTSLIGLGISVWTRSPWLVVGYLVFSQLFEVVREPLQVILLEIVKQIGPAIGKRLTERLNRGRFGKRGSSRRA